METENSETMTVEAIEWPFLKSQRDVGCSHTTSSSTEDHYEIVVSNVDDGTDSLHHFSSEHTPGSDSNFETCLISNADLAALTSSPHVTSEGIKLEPLKDQCENDRVEYDTIQYFQDADLSEATGGDIVMTEDQQKLIKVYQSADNKLITVYEIKPEAVDDDGTGSIGGAGRDVFVEIVSSPDEQLLRGTATLSSDGSLLLGSPDGSDLETTHLSIPASMAAAMGLTTSGLSTVPSMSLSQAPSSTTTTTTATVAELRCTLCGFISFSRDVIGLHCEEAHDLFLCHACNLVFKRKQSLHSHMRAKHGTSFVPNRSKSFSASKTGRIAKKTASASSSSPNQTSKVYNPMLSSPVKNTSLCGSPGQSQSLGSTSSSSTISPDIMLQLPTQPLQPSMLNSRTSSPGERTNFDLMPDIREILAKNKAVMPTLVANTPTSSFNSVTRNKKGAPKGKRQHQKNNWARTLSSGNHPLILDARLSDPVTRNQFNSEFAKKITSHGIGAEMFGISQDRLPSVRGTYRLEFNEKVAENGDVSHSGSSSASGGGEVMYTYEIVDTGVQSEGCKVICGQCNFSNSRIENVLFHCEIDHKQYFCQNQRCQNGFSSWDSLMRHMKNVHKKEKQ